MFYSRRKSEMAAAEIGPEVAGRMASVVEDLAGRAEAVAGFCDRHPEMAMASGLEPIALEMKMILRDGALGRVRAAAEPALRGAAPASAGLRDLDMVHRATELGREALRRAAAHERDLLERPGRALGHGIETAVSVAGSLVMIAAAIA
jgi:hypothetical protein